MDAEVIEKEAHASALVQVSQLFQRPDQLEKLDSIKKRVDRKKAALEAMLRTGVQSQLEGIRTAIGHLSTAVDDVRTVETNLQEIYDVLQKFPELKGKMTKLREANVKHSQYATAMEHVRHIYNIHELVEQTHEFISDGKLLHAHKNIMEMENARDDLTYEVYKLQNSNVEYEINLLRTYFSDVEKLVEELAKQLWYICSRCLEAVRGFDQGPVQLVTALRIIEREERIDQYYLDRKSSSGNFMPSGRPRLWRQKCLEVFANTVRHRIEGNQLEDNTLNKQWLARYLEVCRLVVTEDLKVAKSGAVTCFPPSYGIYDRFVRMYHNCLSLRLREIASETLEKNELVQLLSWIQAYSGEQMLGNPKLQVNAVALLADHPLLPKSVVNQLCDQFVEVSRKDIHDWLEKTLMQEKDDWYKHVHPEEENMGYFYTQLPSILFGMMEDTVSLAKVISTDIITNVMNASIEEFLSFAYRYKDAAMAFKAKHFEDRNYFEKYTPTMIALANNLDICIDSTEKLTKHIRLTIETEMSRSTDKTGADGNNISAPQSSRGSVKAVSRQELLDKVEQLRKRWNIALQAAAGGLLDEVYDDISPHLSQVLGRKWLGLVQSCAIETVCMTVADYHSDYKHLRPHIRCALMMELQYKIVGEYIVSIDNRKISFASYEERSDAASHLKNDAERIRKLFSNLLSDVEMTFTDLTNVLSSMADILCLRDKSLLALETTAFIRKYPDVHAELLSGLLLMREDVGRADARSLAEETIAHSQSHLKSDSTYKRLFQMCKTGTKRALVFDETMRNIFVTLM